MVMVDAVARLLPGALGDSESAAEDSFWHSVLDYPHYTRPREWRGQGVPAVLLSGDHERIRVWRRTQALARTMARRPDVLTEANLSEEDIEIIEMLKKDSMLNE